MTGVITGVLETYEKAATDETLEQEIKDLGDSRAGKSKEEVTELDSQISAKLEEIHALPPEVIDNTEYWEGIMAKEAYVKELLTTRLVVFTKMGAHHLEKIMQELV